MQKILSGYSRKSVRSEDGERIQLMETLLSMTSSTGTDARVQLSTVADSWLEAGQEFGEVYAYSLSGTLVSFAKSKIWSICET